MPEILIPANAQKNSLNTKDIPQKTRKENKVSPPEALPKRKTLSLKKEPPSEQSLNKSNPFKIFLFMPLTVFPPLYCKALAHTSRSEDVDSFSVSMESIVSFGGLLGMSGIEGFVILWALRQIKLSHSTERTYPALLANKDPNLDRPKTWEDLRGKFFMRSFPYLELNKTSRDMIL